MPSLYSKLKVQVNMYRLRSKKRKKICAKLVNIFGDRCYYCTREFIGDALTLRTLDHLIPLCRGGTHDLSNLVLCCTKCNNAKADMTWDEYVQTVEYQKRRDWTIYQREHPPKPKFQIEVLTTLVVT